ncbi:MAG: YgdI/YgdR family lipoprotein [Ruminococcus sp.]|nr:YgdI/YgdR family lipoprotein [Ruminococcus sp.]
MKKIILAVLVTLICLALAGCSISDNFAADELLQAPIMFNDN